ncbi:MAG: type II toxin-antitoxin system RelE/ParE family toxin [Piscirickettsiaceae bacterium]|nr:type II toxin-antitoxin system RelE/ParE family toxin [Piscirickettsiaceae bacterium]
MPSKPLSIVKTPIAERKIIEIAKWSARKWGRKTARDYLDNIERIINLVASGLLPPQKNSEFSERFTYYLAEQHYIFFEIHKDKLIIATLFHTAMSIKERISEERLELQQEIKTI